MSVHVLYDNTHKTVYQHKAGSKFLTSCGIEVNVLTGFGDNPDGEVHLFPISSKGSSQQARIVVHRYMLDSLIQALEQAKTELIDDRVKRETA